MDPAMRDAARRQPPLRRERPFATMLAAALVLSCLLSDPPPTAAGRPNAQAAAEFIARHQGGRASDFAVVYQRPARLSTGETVWATKLVDRRTGAVSLVYRDLAGAMGGPGLVRGRESAAAARQTALERKATQSLQNAVEGRLARMAISGQAGASLPVAVWLAADVAGAERAVVDRHPEVPWVANRPVVNDLATIRSLRAELWTARRAAYVAAAAALRAQVQRLGGSVAYASTVRAGGLPRRSRLGGGQPRPAGRHREPGPGRRLAPIDGDRQSRRGRQLDDQQW